MKAIDPEDRETLQNVAEEVAALLASPETTPLEAVTVGQRFHWHFRRKYYDAPYTKYGE